VCVQGKSIAGHGRRQHEGERGARVLESGTSRSAIAGDGAGDDRPMREPGRSVGGVLARVALGWHWRVC